MKATRILTVFTLAVIVAAAAGCSQTASGEEAQGHGDHSGGGHGDHGGDHGSAAPSQGASDPVLAAYMSIQKALSTDTTTGVAAAASALSKAARAHQGHNEEHNEVATGLIQASSAFEGAALPAAREAFKTLSQRMIRYREIAPGVLSQTYVIHCSMANASWVQTTDQVANPYHGSSMLRCGNVTKGRGTR